jgi:hypothetical protein
LRQRSSTQTSEPKTLSRTSSDLVI